MTVTVRSMPSPQKPPLKRKPAEPALVLHFSNSPQDAQAIQRHLSREGERPVEIRHVSGASSLSKSDVLHAVAVSFSTATPDESRAFLDVVRLHGGNSLPILGLVSNPEGLGQLKRDYPMVKTVHHQSDLEGRKFDPLKVLAAEIYRRLLSK